MSAFADTVGHMKVNSHHPELQTKVNAFLDATGMGPAYFGRKATGNTEFVSRLNDGKRFWPETVAKVLTFIATAQAGKSSIPARRKKTPNARRAA